MVKLNSSTVLVRKNNMLRWNISREVGLKIPILEFREIFTQHQDRLLIKLKESGILKFLLLMLKLEKKSLSGIRLLILRTGSTCMV